MYFMNPNLYWKKKLLVLILKCLDLVREIYALCNSDLLYMFCIISTILIKNLCLLFLYFKTLEWKGRSYRCPCVNILSDDLFYMLALLSWSHDFVTKFFPSSAHLEEENNRLYAQVKLLMEERQEDQNKIRDLVDEVAKLSIEKQERYVDFLSC